MKKPWVKEFINVFVVSLIVTMAFMVFLVFAGIPSTKARNLYNEAITSDLYFQRQKLLQQSLDTWYTPEAAAALQQVGK